MNTLSVSQLVSISELQRDYTSLIERLKKFAKPLYLLRRNKPEAVLVSVDEYEDLVEKRRLYEEELVLKEIAYFEKEKKAGRLLMAKKGEDLFK